MNVLAGVWLAERLRLLGDGIGHCNAPINTGSGAVRLLEADLCVLQAAGSLAVMRAIRPASRSLSSCLGSRCVGHLDLADFLFAGLLDRQCLVT